MAKQGGEMRVGDVSKRSPARATTVRRLLLGCLCVALLGLACTGAGTGTADSGPVANPPGGGEGATAAAVNAEGMRLVGNLPGSYGSFAFWGNLAIVSHAEKWDVSSPDDGFFAVDVSDPTQPDSAFALPLRWQLQRRVHLEGSRVP